MSLSKRLGMNFQSYEKMPTNLKKSNWSAHQIAQLDKVDWVVTEKIHGANFSFIYENQSLSFAKRKELLNWTDDFFGFQLVVERLEDQILNLFEVLSHQIPAQKYTIYGELFGGEYPHPNIDPIANLQAIQTGIYYSPNIHFCAFDIAIEINETNRYYLDYQEAIHYFEQEELLYAKPLFTGRLNTALEFDLSFNSTIPTLLDLPPLTDNLVEGIVVKPFQNLPLEEEGIYLRPILKLKNEAFSEEKKFHQAQKWSFTPQTLTQSENLNFILTDLRNYITTNRLNNVLSKIGQLDLGNTTRMEEIKINYLEDVLQDFNEKNENILDLLDATQQKWLNNRLIAAIQNLLHN